MRAFRTFFLLSSLFLVSVSVISQTKKTVTVTPYQKPKFKLGICYSMQSSFMPNKVEESIPGLGPSWKGGSMFGLTSGVIYKENKISFDYGILYSTQGINYGNPTWNYAPITLKYIKIPFTFNYAPFRKYKIPLVFTGGFQVSNLVSAQINEPKGVSLVGDDRQWFSKTLVDLVWGVGMDIPVTDNFYFDVKVRCDYSTGDPDNINAVSIGGSSYWSSNRSPTHNITIGALFGLEYHF
jgi:hypothetical protein